MSTRTYTVTVAGQSYAVEFKSRTGSTLNFIVEGTEYSVDVALHPGSAQRASTSSSPDTLKRGRSARESTGSEVRAPMPGIVSEVKVSEGNTVQPGDTLLVIEAMKMENPIKSPRSGTIKSLHVTKGQEVGAGATLVTFESNA
jgi:biotin carboxyl carrier protein